MNNIFVSGKNGCVEENLLKSTIYRKSVTVHQKHGSTGHVGEAGVCLFAFNIPTNAKLCSKKNVHKVFRRVRVG